MEYLYLLINTLTLSIPFVASLTPRFAWYKEWRTLVPAITLTAIVYLIWDYFFTTASIWGFSQTYTLGYKLFDLPLEEILFFFCIPYASLFIDHINKTYNRFNLSGTTATVVSISLGILSFGSIIIFTDQLYTTVNSIVFLLILGSHILLFGHSILRRFYASFVIILIPFVMVNGILTGMLLLEPIVWYNAEHIIGIRIGTIPIEDSLYALSLLLMVLTINAMLSKTENITNR